MKKIVLAFGIMGLLVAGCGSGGSDDTTTQSKPDYSSPIVSEHSYTTAQQIVVTSALCSDTSYRVSAKQEVFTPHSITIPVGGVVMWTNDDLITDPTYSHNYYQITSDDMVSNGTGTPVPLFDTSVFTIGKSVCLQFKNPGTFGYHCAGTVTGVVNVVSSGQTTTTVSQPTTTNVVSNPTTT